MRRLAPLLLVLLAAAAAAEEPAGVQCGFYALVDEGLGLKKNGPQRAYDGLRKGLELARMPRVCLAEWDAAHGGLKGYLERLERSGGGPVFALGERTCAKVAASGVPVRAVLAVQRYAAAGAPWDPLPEMERSAVVYASMDIARVGDLLRRLTGRERPRVALACKRAEPDGDAARRFAAGSRLEVVTWSAQAKPDERTRPDVLLHLRLGIGETPMPFDEALAWARDAHVPLVTDLRDRFGQGAVVTFAASDDLLGRAAAEAARRMLRDPATRPPPRAIAGVAAWVDLMAADEQGLEVPLPFLARADLIKRGRAAARAPR